MSSNILKKAAVKGVRTYRTSLNHKAKTEDEETPASKSKETVGETEEAAPHKDEKEPGQSHQSQVEYDEEVQKEKEKAQKELEQLKKQLYREVEEAKEKAEQEGYSKGYGEGYAQGVEAGRQDGQQQGREEIMQQLEVLKNDAQRQVEEARNYLAEAQQRYRETIAESEKTVVDLAVGVAEKLLKVQLDLAPEKVMAIVRHSIGSLPEGEAIRVFVNQEDYSVCEQYRDTLEEELKKVRPDLRTLEFIPDENLDRGSCRIESESGAVEYLLDDEKAQLRETLMELARKEAQKKLNESEEEEADG